MIAGRVDDMSDISAVKALAACDEDFGGDELLGAQDPGGNVQHFGGLSAIDPCLVYSDNRIAHSGDQVNEVIVLPGLGQPYRVADFEIIPAALQAAQSLRHVVRGEE